MSPWNTPSSPYASISFSNSTGSGTPIGNDLVADSATIFDSNRQRATSLSGESDSGLSLALSSLIDSSVAAAGSSIASRRPRIVARMKSSAAVGCSSMNVWLV